MTICLERGNIFKQSASRSFTSEISGLRKQYGMRGWRNWQTRTFEVRVVYPWGFESPPSHQKPVHIVCWFFFFCLCDGRGSNRAAAHSAASNQPSGLLLSPRVPTRRNVYRGSCKSKDFMAFLFCKPWLHGFCTVSARSVFSMSDDVGRCIALQSVPFFASGEQG